MTEYQEVRARLEARDDLFRILLENALDIITILDPDGTIRYESPAVLRILGWEPHELEGHRAFEFMPEEDAVKATALLQGLLATPGATGTLAFRFRHKDGSWRTLEAIGKNMLDHPMLAGFLVNSRDVTERRRVEDELARQQAARIQSEKLADMGTLLAGVAHELNNPLTVVSGYSSILRQTLGDGPSRERLDRIAAAAERCVRIVRNFLALARQHPPERQKVDANRVVREAVELLAYPLRVDNVEVRLELAEDLPTLWADPHQLHQVVVNLITNAHQAMHGNTSTRRLTLRTRFKAADSRVSIEVIDTGGGIPPEVLGRIFEPFFTTKPVGQGTGLGSAPLPGHRRGARRDAPGRQQGRRGHHPHRSSSRWSPRRRARRSRRPRRTARSRPAPGPGGRRRAGRRGRARGPAPGRARAGGRGGRRAGRAREDRGRRPTISSCATCACRGSTAPSCTARSGCSIPSSCPASCSSPATPSTRRAGSSSSRRARRASASPSTSTRSTA